MMNAGALLFDGASRKKALVWLSQTYPEHSLRPLLHGQGSLRPMPSKARSKMAITSGISRCRR